MTTKKPAVLVASSYGSKVVFHEKGQETEHNISSFIPPHHHIVDRQVREDAYFYRGRYSGEKSNKRYLVLMKKRVAGILFRSFRSLAQTPIRVSTEQLESFGYTPPKEEEIL